MNYNDIPNGMLDDEGQNNLHQSLLFGGRQGEYNNFMTNMNKPAPKPFQNVQETADVQPAGSTAPHGTQANWTAQDQADFDAILKKHGFTPPSQSQKGESLSDYFKRKDAERAQAHKDKIAQLQAEIPETEKKANIGAGKAFFNEFSNEFTPAEVLRRTPGALFDTALKDPLKFAYSVGSLPVDYAREAMGKDVHHVELPLLGQTFQGEASDQQKDILEGKQSLWSALEPFVKVPLAGASTAAWAKFLSPDIQYGNLEDYFKSAPKITPDMSLEGIETTQEGWANEGMRQQFDSALKNGDAETVRKMLPKIPNAYAQRMGDIINQTLGEKAVTMGGVKIPSGLSQAQAAMQTAKEAKAAQSAAEKLNPKLSGKALAKEYEKAALEDRINPRNFLGRQNLDANQEAVRLGQNLKDVITEKDPARNLMKLGDEMKNTGEQLDGMLAAQKTPADMKELGNQLEQAKEAIPREYRGIKESKSVFEDVMDYAKEQLTQQPTTQEGVRNARIAFDQQAIKEFPSAYKDGRIDIKAPAGRAIKLARDTMNNYLYNSAEDGGVIKDLIARESDIYDAIHLIAPKAAATHGLRAFGALIKRHPVLSTIIGIYGLNKVIPGSNRVIRTADNTANIP